jgi:hypothetical protein
MLTATISKIEPGSNRSIGILIVSTISAVHDGPLPSAIGARQKDGPWTFAQIVDKLSAMGKRSQALVALMNEQVSSLRPY